MASSSGSPMRAAILSNLSSLVHHPSLRAALIVHAAASYSVGAAALRAKAFGTLWEILDGSWRRQRAIAAAQSLSDVRARSRWSRMVGWLKMMGFIGGNREEVEEGVLGILDMIIACVLLRRLTHSSLFSLLFYPLVTLPLPLALPHLISSSSALLSDPAVTSAPSTVSGLLILVQALPTAFFHELEHLLALLILDHGHRRRKSRPRRSRIRAVKPRGRSLPSADANQQEDDGCCICFSQECGSTDPIEAFCLSATQPFSRHFAHRSCLLTWYFTSRRRVLPTSTTATAATRTDRFQARRRQAAAGLGFSVSIWSDVSFSVFVPSAPSLTLASRPPSAMPPAGEDLWRASMAQAAEGPEAWNGGIDYTSSSDEEDTNPPSGLSTASSDQLLGGPWGLGHLSSITVSTPSSTSDSASPPAPGVHLRVSQAFVRARNERGRTFWWGFEESELRELLQDPSVGMEAMVGLPKDGKTIVGELVCAGADAPSCPVCRSPLSILMELSRPSHPRRSSSKAGHNADGTTLPPTAGSPLLTQVGFSCLSFFLRCGKLWRRRLGPTSLLNKVLLHTFMRVVLTAAARVWIFSRLGGSIGASAGSAPTSTA